MDEPIWDTAFAEEPADTPRTAPGASRLASARALANGALIASVVGVVLPPAIFAATMGISENSGKAASILLIAIFFPALVALEGVSAIGIPLLGVVLAVVALMKLRRSAFAADEFTQPLIRGERSIVRRVAIAAIVIPLALPTVIGVVLGVSWFGTFQQGLAWDSSFSRDRVALDAAATSVLPAARKASAESSDGVDPVATTLPPQFASLSETGQYFTYSEDDALCIYFPRSQKWSATAGYGFAYCPGTATPDDAGIYSAHQVAPHWWVASPNPPEGD